MSTIKAIRDRLGLTQTELAEGIGCTQGNVGHYEKGQTVPPDAAKRLIVFAASRGVAITYEDIYGPVRLPKRAGRATTDRPAARAKETKGRG
jgi:putative transcriptional regulator